MGNDSYRTCYYYELLWDKTANWPPGHSQGVLAKTSAFGQLVWSAAWEDFTFFYRDIFD